MLFLLCLCVLVGVWGVYNPSFDLNCKFCLWACCHIGVLYYHELVRSCSWPKKPSLFNGFLWVYFFSGNRNRIWIWCVAPWRSCCSWHGIDFAWPFLIFHYYAPITTSLCLCLSCLGACIQVMAVDMSYRLGWIDDMLVKRVLNILQQAKLPTAPPDTITVEMFKSVMAVRELNVTVRTSSIWFLSSLKCLYSYPLAGR